MTVKEPKFLSHGCIVNNMRTGEIGYICRNKDGDGISFRTVDGEPILADNLEFEIMVTPLETARFWLKNHGR